MYRLQKNAWTAVRSDPHLSATFEQSGAKGPPLGTGPSTSYGMFFTLAFWNLCKSELVPEFTGSRTLEIQNH